jgi:cytochrome P450
VRRHANALIDKIVDVGECEFDEAFAIPLPCTAFLSLLGLPHDHLDHFLELKDGIIRPDTTDPDEAARIRANTGRQIYAYFEDVIEKRRSNPGDDTLSYLVKAEIDGKRLERNEILDICFLLIIAGLDTVTATLGCSIAYLAANPEQRERLVRNPAQIPGAVEELLRWETPVMAVPRVAKSDITMRDVQIKKGELVTLLLGASNTDGEIFTDAETVDFARERNRHIAFGAGPHRCLGSHLARLELRVALEEWHRRVPEYSIKPGEVPIYSIAIREVKYLPLVWQPARGASS